MDQPTDKKPDLYHLIYSSSATERLSQARMLELLKVSRQNNERSELTGLLLYRHGIYMQLLEGRQDDVKALLARLREDPRHRGIRILREGKLAARMFPEWSMAYKNLAGLRSSAVPGYSECLQGHYVPENHKTPTQQLIDMFQTNLIAA